MKRQLTARDLQRHEFIESLHTALRRQTKQAIAGRDHFIQLAKTYLEDGLDPSECAELLIIEGVEREAASCYIDMVLDESDEVEGEEYSFSFEDPQGRIWSSFEVGRSIYASSEEDAWQKAEGLMDADPGLEIDRIVSIHKVI